MLNVLMNNLKNETKEMNNEKRTLFGMEFCKEIVKGREAKRDYCRLVLEFGDIYSTEKMRKGTGIKVNIANGRKVSDLITPNMEAMMRTIIMIGCAKDWPAYLNSTEYMEWISSKHPVPKNKNNEFSGSLEPKIPTENEELTDDSIKNDSKEKQPPSIPNRN